MRNVLIGATALGMLAFGLAMSTVEAAPVVGGQAIAQAAPTNVDHVWWRRVCDRDGDRCHRVWIRPRYYWWR